MSKKNSAKKTANEIKLELDSAYIELKKIYEPTIGKPVNPITGKVIGDESQEERLRYIAADLGWTSNEFAYRSQIKANGGTIRKGAYYVPVFYGGRYFPLYNFDDVTWGEGRPDEFVQPTYEKRQPKKKAEAETIKAKLPNGIEVELTMEQLLELSKR